MKNILSALLLLAAVVVSAAGQTPTPTPTPNQPVDDGQVVKIRTNLIQVDVSVTDRKGNPVPGLTADDFEIYENGERQNISGVRFVAGGSRGAKPLEKPDTSKDAIPVPQTVTRPEDVRRTIAIVVDDLSLSFESAYQTRRALRKFVEEQVQEGDLVAIIRTGAGIGALQQFTSDKRQLLAAVDRVKWNPSGSGGIGAFAPIEPTPLEEAKANGDDSITEEDLKQERDSNNALHDFRSSVFVSGTLGALRYVVTGMSELPGRKSVVLFSDGFRLMERDEMGGSGTGRVFSFLKQLIDLANRASVVFYTVDARGLQYTGITAQDKITNPTDPNAVSQVLSDRRDQLFETQAGPRYLSEETGGFSVYNNNDLAGGVRQVLEDQSYYLIGYEPDSETFDAAKRRFNKLEVKVRRDDVKVRYRSGFFNNPDENIVKLTKVKTPQQQLFDALSSPFAVSDISLRLNALFGNDPRTGSYIKALLHIDVKDLKFTTMPDGQRKASFEVLMASFGDNGVPVDQMVTRGYTVTVNDANFKRLQAEGIVYYLAFPIKKPGAYQYRVAVRDPQADRVGSASQFVEVPDLKKSRHVLSGIVLDSFSTNQWQQLVAGKQESTEGASPLADSSLRRFGADSVLRYGFEIYNAKRSPAGKPSLTTKIRVIRDGKIVLDGQTVQVDLSGQTDMQRVKAAGVVAFGRSTQPGEYILQVIVTDTLAKQKQQIATQFVQFEIKE